jgi:hypothetical protein
LKIVTAIIFLFSSFICAYAANENDFCTSYVALLNDSKNPNISFSSMATMIFTPKKMIHAEFLGQKHESNKAEKSKQANKVIFVHLVASEFNSKILENLKIKEKEIGKLDMVRKLRTVKTIEDCQIVVDSNSEDYRRVENYLNDYSNHQDDIKASRDKKNLILLSKKMQKYIRMGWVISYVHDLFEMYHEIENNQLIEQIMLVAHSDQLGRLYDAKKNIFPKGAFSNLPHRVRKVIVYSCNAKKVIDFYDIKKLSAKLDYYYPVVNKNFNNIFESQIPAVAINGMAKAAKAKLKALSVSYDVCSLKISMNEASQNVVVMINDYFAGSVRAAESYLTLDCQLLSETTNQVKMYYLGEVKRFPLEVSSIVIESSRGESHALKLKEFLSPYDHNHILTLGITGGIK